MDIRDAIVANEPLSDTKTTARRMETVATFVLSFHASYACRDRGACCTSGWPIPVEADVQAGAERAMADGRLRTAREYPERANPRAHEPASVPAFIRPSRAPREAPALVGTAADACVFYRRTGSARCEWHRALGHAAIPLACRQFPRVSLIDPRGVSVTLSHYCPTAADLLEDDGPVAVTESAPAFPAAGEYVGLDAIHALPPALRPDMLMDWESWWLWEREAVALVAAVDDPDEAIARLAAAVESIRRWKLVDGSLGTAVTNAFREARIAAPSTTRRSSTIDTCIADLLASVPNDHRDQAVSALRRPPMRTSRRAHQRFLAAHAFANWTAHLGEGLRTWLRSIETVHALVASGRSVRDTDLVLRHLADPYKLAGIWKRVERE